MPEKICANCKFFRFLNSFCTELGVPRENKDSCGKFKSVEDHCTESCKGDCTGSCDKDDCEAGKLDDQTLESDCDGCSGCNH